ncbi:DUF732 domain-containing protein [Pseudonocardia ailaonensis]|uniref:DUF732 domain-containing protein n=1 Tax=Pseudonocardia ailaonensis TaxID=367279 RepID=UPI0031D209D7
MIVGASAALAGISTAAIDAGRIEASAASAVATGDRAFLAAVSGRPSFSGVAGGDLIALGHTVCDALKKGASRSDLVSAGISNGFLARDARALVDAAHASYCPTAG